MNRRRDLSTTMTGPERHVERRPYTAAQTERGGALRVFNIRQKQTTSGLPSAMELALQKAVKRHG